MIFNLHILCHYCNVPWESFSKPARNYKLSVQYQINSGLEGQLFYSAKRPRVWEKPIAYELQLHVG